MEPVTGAALAATVVPIATGAAGEPGAAAWSALAGFAARHGAAAECDAVEDTPGDPARAAALAEALASLAARDETAAAWLRDWLAGADRLVDVPHVPEATADPVHGSVARPQV